MVLVSRLWRVLVALALVVLMGMPIGASAQAALTDDRFDGDIFALYAGNGSLVPPKVSLAASMAQKKPAIMVFYIDDSSDCKSFSLVVSQLQAGYGRVANFLPIRVDSLPVQDSYALDQPGHYYKGYVPQIVVTDQDGQVRLDETGKVPFEKIDDTLRQIYDLLPRAESPALQRRQVNEVNEEFFQPPTPPQK
jgi:hypothetical protein